MTSRQYAILSNAPTYEGKPCPVCSGEQRYTVNGSCVRCTNRKNLNAEPRFTDGMHHANKEARRQATESGAPTYERMTPCPKCAEIGVHTTLRYTSNGGCVECQIRRSSTEASKRKEARNRPALSPLVPTAARCSHGDQLRAVLPELEGKTLAFTNHELNMLLHGGKSKHVGKCALCSPDLLIMMCNNVLHQGYGQIEPHVARWMYAMYNVPVTAQGWPIVVTAMREHNAGRKATPAHDPLPGVHIEPPAVEIAPPLNLPFDS